MIASDTLLTYSPIATGFIFVPGPASVLTTAQTIASGVKVGMATGAGITAGDILHTIMAVLGISAIIATSATLFLILKYLGAAYSDVSQY